jgi:hypothetical protein
MKLSDGITQAYERKWSMVNTFNVQFNISPVLEERVGQINNDINLNIVSVTTPDFTNDPIEAFIANRWFINNGKDALYRFSITFRDEDQMKLYRKFFAIYNFTKNNYFDDAKMTINISKDADWYGEKDKILMILEGSIIEAISNLSLSNDTENQIAEFTVNFKCNNPSIPRI